MSRIVIGVMGPGAGATEQNVADARELGSLIAERAWVTLSGGRNAGVMAAVSQGAHQAAGFVVGVLPTRDEETYADGLDLVIVTDMGNARNNINVLSSRVVVACGMGTGTASEVALALKSEIPVILLNAGEKASEFYRDLSPALVQEVSSPVAAIEAIEKILASS